MHFFRNRTLLKIVIFNIISIAILCAAAELYSRRYFWSGMKVAKEMPDGSYVPVEYFGRTGVQAMYQQTTQGFLPEQGHYRISSHVLSGIDVEISFDKNRTRVGNHVSGDTVLILGDSITSQDYLNLPQTWVDQAEAALGGSIQIINSAIPSLGIQGELLRLREIGSEVHPKVVVLAWYLNDLTSCCAVMHFLPRIPSFQSAFIDELDKRFFWKVGSVYRVEKDLTGEDLIQMKARMSSGTGSSLSPANRNKILEAFEDWGNAWSPDAWPQYRKALSEFNEVVKKLGSTPLVVAFPHRDQTVWGGLDDYPQQQLKTVLSELSIPLIDLLPVLRQSRKRGEEAFMDHCHLTAGASKIISPVIAEELKKVLYTQK